MNTNIKGDKLEDKLYRYLNAQKDRKDLVYDAHPHYLCKVFKKKKYYCKIREAEVEFDVVIELYRKGKSDPYLFIIFECKNHKRSVEENRVTDFSHKLGRMFEHRAKGIIVTSSQLQSGAKKVAQNAGLAIVKFDVNGMETIAERHGGIVPEQAFLQSQLTEDTRQIKSLKFSAFSRGSFFSSMEQLIRHLDPDLRIYSEHSTQEPKAAVSFVKDEHLRDLARKVLNRIDYETGPVDFCRLCKELEIRLEFTNEDTCDDHGNIILGWANFDTKSISINSHKNPHRERFTIAHEIGHFCLSHDRFLQSEAVLERDLITAEPNKKAFHFERLEYQANAFAAHLIMPNDAFYVQVAILRNKLGIKDKGHGYIFVDNQPCNFQIYNFLLSELSSFFECSKSAAEIKLKKLNMLVDERNFGNGTTLPETMGQSFRYV